MRSRHDADDRRLDSELSHLGDETSPPSEEVLRTMAHRAASARRPLERPSRSSAGSRMLVLTWTVIPVAIALLVGSGLGFGLASSATPEGAAGTPFAGFGFLPVRGWTVLQGGSIGPDGSTRAIAANVRLHRDDRFGDLPRATLDSLPPRGVVIRATFSARGDPGVDSRFADQALPIRISSAYPVEPGAALLGPLSGITERQLRAGVGSYNVDLRVFFGSEPTPAMLAAAQRQLDRLVVASERVTLVARPLVTEHRQPVTLFGAIDSRRSGEPVDIQAKDCGQTFFRGVAGTTTRDGGSWSAEYVPGIRTTLRAVWKGNASAPVTVGARAIVVLRVRPNGDLTVGIEARTQFWRRHVLLQRRVSGAWKTIATVRLTDTAASPGIGWAYTSARLGPSSFPKGALVRAVLPRSQARPCYLASISDILRT